MRHFFKSKRLSTKHKVKIYKTYVETTLLYNSETWAMTEKQEDSLNSFQRRLLRIALNIKYPKIISNAKLYSITKEIPISEKIKRIRLALLGHILRLDVDTPAQKALQFYLTPHKRPAGRPVTIWVQIITKDLKNTTTSKPPLPKPPSKN